MTKNPYWLYLEALRRSGETNMYGADPYLIKRFDLDKKEAIQALINWMQNYNPEDYEVDGERISDEELRKLVKWEQ